MMYKNTIENIRCNKKIFIFLILLCIFTNHYGQKKQQELYSYTLKKIKEGIYVSQRPEPLRESVDGNFTIIITEKDVLVIDASATPSGARLIIADIKKLTNKPVRYLINTHFHGDHTFGNQEFKKAFPGIEIISTKETAQVMETRVKTFKSIYSNDSIFKARRLAVDSQITDLKNHANIGNDKIIANLERYRDHDIYVLRENYKDLLIVPPTLIFEKEFIIKRRDGEIKLLYLGKGDTPGDAWVYLPAEKILIAGDALPHPVPFGFTNTPVQWIESLKKALDLDFEILIPGHGDVQYGKEYIKKVIALLHSVNEHVGSGIEKGMTLEQIQGTLQIGEHEKAITNNDPFLQYYFNDYFKKPIVSRFYNDLKANRK